MRMVQIKTPFPCEGLVYDYSFDAKQLAWKHWMDGVNAAPIPDTMEYNQIIVQVRHPPSHTHSACRMRSKPRTL